MNDNKNDLTALGVGSVRVQTWIGNQKLWVWSATSFSPPGPVSSLSHPPKKGPQYVHAWANKKKTKQKQLITASQGQIFLNSIKDVLNNPEMKELN